MAVVLPAAIASRTSVQVMSSMSSDLAWPPVCALPSTAATEMDATRRLIRALLRNSCQLSEGTVECGSEMVNEQLTAVRLDVWLDVACLFRTRSEAQKACKGGKVAVNQQAAKANRLLRVGDEIEIGRPFGRKQRVVVRAVAD